MKAWTCGRCGGEARAGEGAYLLPPWRPRDPLPQPVRLCLACYQAAKLEAELERLER